MRAVIQRVQSAKVTVNNEIISEIGPGILVLLGVSKKDERIDVTLLAKKVAKLRIFNDENNKMNLSVADVNGEALVVSNFTLLGDCRHGHRPSFVSAAETNKANTLYEFFVSELLVNGIGEVKKGIFGADMKVELVNDGPVTITLDTEEIG